MMLSERPGENGAELMTASWPLSASASFAVSAASTCTVFSLSDAGSFSGLRATAVTLCPRETSSCAILLPIFPVAPMSATFISASRTLLDGFGENGIAQQERQRRHEFLVEGLVRNG